MLLLIYVLLCTYFVIFALFYDWLQSVYWALDVYYYHVAERNSATLTRNILIQIGYMLNGTIATLMTMFLKFHINLALTNKTTIENLDKKGAEYTSIYDIGNTNNWQ